MTRSKTSDPSLPIRERAAAYSDVAQSTSCTQSSFKVGKTAFLYIGMQGGRHKAMFKLDASRDEAAALAAAEPDRFQIGFTAWVTARFTEEEPLPARLWKRWLDESYALSVGKPTASKKKTSKKVAKKKASRKKAAKKRAVKKAAEKRASASGKTTKKRVVRKGTRRRSS